MAVVIAAAAALPLAAHHNQAVDFNINQPMTFKGVVTKVEGMNPHAFLHLDITDSDGKVTSWLVMLSSPNSLKRQGVTRPKEVVARAERSR